ncbi:SpoIIE family protein phosphatase [Actinacidiphila soli]|uniref:SpoIIE family protein phosphatase n=1 Tax=Actinacidiphila soli TaxID=2487275 RepID=UPI000FCA1E43|nr:SpoIIE family protein phosphatase [Actinacidiphila soli]
MTDDPPGIDALAATVDRLRHDLTLARESADTRALIGIATGILVERGHGGPAEAARYLRELADAARLSPAEVAADIVNAASGAGLSRTLPTASPSGHGGDRPPTTPVLTLRTAEAGTLSGDPQTAAEALLRQALPPLGGTALAIWRTAPDGSLTLAGHAGLAPGEAAQWRYVPPGVGTLPQLAFDDARPRWHGSLPQHTPGIGRRDGTAGARAVLPARLGGRILGVLEVCWPGPHTALSPSEHRQLDVLADLCAHTLSGAPTDTYGPAPVPEDGRLAALSGLADGLLDPALVLRPLVDGRGEVGDFLITHANEHFTDPAGRPRGAVIGVKLLEAYPLAAQDGGLYAPILRVHATGQPFRAEQIASGMLVGPEPLGRAVSISISRYGEEVLLSWRVEDEAGRLTALLQHTQRLSRLGGFQENLVTGDVIWSSELFALHGLQPTDPPIPLEELRRHAHPDDSIAIGRFLRTVLHRHHQASTAFRLQRDDGVVRHIRVIAEPVTDLSGDLIAVRGAYQDVSAQHWTEVALAATRDQLADTEQRAAERNRLALQLQQAIMPPAPAPIDASGLRVAVRYRPAEKEHLVGGDWYDVVVLPSKQVLLAVGDIAGHGIDAATGMVVLRNALRGLATTGAGPGRLMGWLNTVAHHLTEQVTATAVCGLYDPETGVLCWARAGHPPPVLIRDGEAASLPLPRGILLGAIAETTYEEQRLTLASGDRLLMYTDGLVERRGISVERSLEQLLATAGGPLPGLDEQLDLLLTHSRSDTDDDTCLIGVQLC